MTRYKLIISLLLIILICGCKGTDVINSSVVKKDQYFFRTEELKEAGDEDKKDEGYVVYKTKVDIAVKKIKIDGNTLIISPRDKNRLERMTDTLIATSVLSRKRGLHQPVIKTGENLKNLLDPLDQEYFLKTDSLKNIIGVDLVSIRIGKPIKYKETEALFKAISIPLRFRFATDSVNYTVSSSVSVGLSYGLKKTNYRYRPIFDNDKLIQHKLRKLSTSWVGFVGLSPISLTSSNTENLTADRTVLGFNAGGAFVLGINKLSLGLALGTDIGLGKDAKNWRYQTQPWLGVIIGLDFY